MSKRILALSPHPDDMEFGCGASIAQFIAGGAEVWNITFSPCVQSLPSGVAKDTLYAEHKEATGILGIAADHVTHHDFPVREFSYHRQEILEILVALRKDINPDMVLLPNSDDMHQDHQVIHQEGVRAFKHSQLLGYELPWNSKHFACNFYQPITEEALHKKWQAIAAYASQKDRPYFDRPFFEGLARVRGVQANTAYAEAFELISWVA